MSLLLKFAPLLHILQLWRTMYTIISPNHRCRSRQWLRVSWLWECSSIWGMSRSVMYLSFHSYQVGLSIIDHGPDRTEKPDWTRPNIFRFGPRSTLFLIFGPRSSSVLRKTDYYALLDRTDLDMDRTFRSSPRFGLLDPIGFRSSPVFRPISPVSGSLLFLT